MAKTKKEDITRIAALATPCSSTGCIHIAPLPKNFLGKRVMIFLKEDFDKMKRQQERKETEAIGVFARALISGGKRNGC
jgi:hypothetical protein